MQCLKLSIPNLESSLPTIIVASLVTSDHTVLDQIRSQKLQIKKQELKKGKLALSLPCLNMSIHIGDNLLKGLSLFAITMAKLVILNLIVSS